MKNWLLSLAVAVGLAAQAHAGVDTVVSGAVYTQLSVTSYEVIPGANLSQGFSITLASGETCYKLEASVLGVTVNLDSGTCYDTAGYMRISFSSSLTGGRSSVGGANGEYNHRHFVRFGHDARDEDSSQPGPYVDYTPRTGTITFYVAGPASIVDLPAESVGCPGNAVVVQVKIWKGRRVNVPSTTSMSDRPAGADLLAGSVLREIAG